MSTGKAGSWTSAVFLAVVVAVVTVGCGGGGGSSGSSDGDGEDLFVERFSVPNFAGILLDESVSLHFSESVKKKTLNHDSIQFRTGVQGGQAPRGSFVRGSFLFDPDSGTRVVIDPDPIGNQQIDRIQKKGDLELVPDEIRYDLGFNSNQNGSRMVLLDDSQSRTVTFVPEVPTRLDLSDSGYESGATYTVVIPAFPATNTVQSKEGSPVLQKDGRTFVSSFTTVPTTSPYLFLGGENAGAPRLVNSSPADSESGILPDDVIFIRFSQPIDPRTVTPENFFLNIVSVPGRPQLEVSLFLRQSRTGEIEVVMTPLLDMPGDQWFEVTVGQGVRDLLGASVPPATKFSFSTAVGNPKPTDIIESFTNNAQEEELLTVANWNGTKPYVGAEEGALVAAYAPFAGSGIDGTLNPNAGDITILDTGSASGAGQQQYYYTSINVQIGVTILAEGEYGLVLRSQGDISIFGEIEVGGLAGGIGQTGSAGGQEPTGGAGGVGGVGGYAGGDGAMTVIGTGGNFEGIDGDGPGGGQGGSTGDQEETPTADTDPPNAARMREAGGGGAHATDGGDADYAGWGTNAGGGGGTAYGEGDFSDAPRVPAIIGVPTLTLGFGGSGGGGGGGEDDHPAPTSSGQLGDGQPGGEDEGGGGGGGGGGALQITAYGDVVIEGRIRANGGIGGNSYNESTGGLGQGAAGGGGAGGSIWIQAFGDITFDAAAIIEALGGDGGLGDSITNRAGLDKQEGGVGGDGYIRLEDSDGSIVIYDGISPQGDDLVGTFTPRIALDSYAQSRWYNQYFPTPDYGAAEIDRDLNNGSIIIEVQAAREDITTPGSQPVDPALDPERTNSTDWMPIVEIDRLDNFQYLRFRVFFTVDPMQDFASPLPIIREIKIPVLAGS